MNDASYDKLIDTSEFLDLEELVGRFYEEQPRGEVQVEFGAATHVGLRRSNNEDNFIITCRRRRREVLRTSLPIHHLEAADQVAYVAAVADGMGGHSFGELASELALRTGWKLGGGEVKWPLKVNTREAEELKDKARVYFQLIDKAIHAKAVESPDFAGMGTTLTICYTTGPALFVVHAGDSRSYLFRDSALRQLTRDHTLAQELIDSGNVHPSSSEVRRSKHVLTNCLGGPYLSVDVDVDFHRLRDGDRLLVCTDGLTDVVNDDDIARVLAEQAQPQDACEALVNLALTHGGPDNVTVLVGNYRFPAMADTADYPRLDHPT